MKIAIATLLFGTVAAFAPSKVAFRTYGLNAVTTGPKGKAASSAEEDLELTRAVIMGTLEAEDEPEVEDE